MFVDGMVQLVQLNHVLQLQLQLIFQVMLNAELTSLDVQ
jgi:hypothetical protein